MLSRALFEFASMAVSNGYSVALATICLLHYVAHVHRLGRVRRELSNARTAHEIVRRELRGMTSELDDLKRDRALNRFETQVLREFLSQENCDQAVRAFMRRIVSDRGDGFAAFLRFKDGDLSVWQSHGFVDVPPRTINFEAGLLSQLTAGDTVSLNRIEARRSRFWDALSPLDRNRIAELHLFPVGPPGDLLGILATTGLAPTGAEPARRFELARRLVASISPRLRDKLHLEVREDRLHLSEDMLALRAVADREYASPMQMLEAFLDRASEKLGAERGALFLFPREAASAKALVRAGAPLQPGLREAWSRHEQRLAIASLSLRGVRQYPVQELALLGISTLIGSALVMPVVQRGRALGLVVFSRRVREPFSDRQEQLAAWSGGLLAELLPRVVAQAAVERRARLDGLTQLANRFEFDQRIEQELEAASRARTNLSLLMFDLDHFKAVNDTHGHRAGDAVLRAVSGILLECVQGIRATDRPGGWRPLVARYGGEELAVLSRLDLAGARRIGELARNRVETQPIEFEGLTIRVTASVGLAVFPQHAESAGQLIAAADAALYLAKANGRNRLELAFLEMVP